MAFSVDYAWGRPTGAGLVSAGCKAVGRYLYPGGGKGLTGSELADLLHYGIAVWFIFEGTGMDASSVANGVADAQLAQQQAAGLGYPNAVIYFAVDEQTAPDAISYFKGVNSVIGVDRTAVYGGIDTVELIQRAGLAKYFWQTYAWSRGQVAPGIHIYQHLNGQTINGAAVDYDETLQADFGQISGTAAAGSVAGAAPFQGNISNEPTTWVQEHLNAFGYHLVVDDIYGPATTSAVRDFQSKHGLTVDGITGPQTVGALGAGPTSRPGALTVDGIWGGLTTQALQRALGVTADGIIGPQTIAALQRRLGITADGINGPQTHRALQARLGVAQDGIWGPATTRALQSRLNAGTF